MPVNTRRTTGQSLHPLVEYNRRFQEAMAGEDRSALRQRYGVLREEFVAHNGGKLVRPLELPLLFPERSFEQLVADGTALDRFATFHPENN